MSAPIYVYPKTCAICGKPALYILPPEGRCRKHRQTLTAAVVAERARREPPADAWDQRDIRIGNRMLTRNELLRSRAHLHSTKKGRK